MTGLTMPQLNGKTVFITGGSGYVGRNLIRTLIREGANVRALARSQESADIVRALGAQPISGDILDERSLPTGLEKADYLVQAAADKSHSAPSALQNSVIIAGASLCIVWHEDRKLQKRFI